MSTQSPIIPRTADIIFQGLTLFMLGLAATPESFPLVRTSWPTEGQPGYGVDQDITVIATREVDDEYNRVADQELSTDPLDPNFDNITTTYVRVWEVTWIVLGPTSFDRARIIRTKLRNDEATKQFLESFQLAPVTDPSAPVRAPEPFAGGQWWERVDFSCRFNELTTEQSTVGTVKSTEVRTYVESSPSISQPFSDITIVSSQG